MGDRERQMTGDCTDSGLDPDIWFPEIPNGRPSQSKMHALGESIRNAIDTCENCSIKAECLADGMRDENISHGIWGGVMAGERVLLRIQRDPEYSMTHDDVLAVDAFDRLGQYMKR